MNKILFVLICCITFGVAHAEPALMRGFVPGGNGILDAKSRTPSGQPLFDGLGRPTGNMSPVALYSGFVSAATVTSSGAYAPADLPLALTVAGNALGQTAQLVPTGYTVTSAVVVAAGNACPAASVFTLAGTGTKIIVSDGNGLSGSVVTVSVGGAAATASDVPANPVTLTSSTSGCTPPQFTLGWGLVGVSVQLPGWGYTMPPSVTAPASSLSGGVVASVLAQVQTGPVNLASQMLPSSALGTQAVSFAQGNASAASARALYAGSVSRKISEKWSDIPNAKDLGMGLSGNTISQDQALIPNLMKNNVTDPNDADIQSREVDIPAGRWPSQTNIPTNVGDTDFINVLGRLALYPFFQVAEHNIGMGVPYFGDGVLSATHNAGDGANLEYARVDSNGTSKGAYRPSVSYTFVGDTPNEPGNMVASGQKNAQFNHITTARNAGNSQNINEHLYSMSMAGSGEFDVNHWTHTDVYGNAWVWGHINELYQMVPYSLGLDKGPVSPIWGYEVDMGGVGPENPASAYDFTQSSRKMYWLTTNHNINNDANSNSDLSWSANTRFLANRVILKAGAAGERMYRNTSGDATSGATEPAWPTTIGGTAVDGGITWQDMGVYTYDIGCLFCVGGAADGGHNERIGTLMGETTDAIYNAIFDFSKAKFDPSVSTNIFARLQSNMYLDLSADGTKAGQNNRLLGYSSSDNALEYQANHKLVLKVNDSGELDIEGPIAGLNGKLEATNVIQADAGVNAYGNISLYGNAAIDITPSAPSLRTLSYKDGGLSYRIAAEASATKEDINPFKVDDSGLVTLNEGLVIGSDTKKFTNGKDAVWAYGSDGNTPASRIGLEYSYPDVHLMVDSSDFGMLVRRVSAPASSSASCNEGDIAQDQSYIYMCIAPNSWKRSALESW